jgi:hypothetical protein
VDREIRNLKLALIILESLFAFCITYVANVEDIQTCFLSNDLTLFELNDGKIPSKNEHFKWLLTIREELTTKLKKINSNKLRRYE